MRDWASVNATSVAVPMLPSIELAKDWACRASAVTSELRGGGGGAGLAPAARAGRADSLRVLTALTMRGSRGILPTDMTYGHTVG